MTTRTSAHTVLQSLRQGRLPGWVAVIAGVVAAFLWLTWASPSWWVPIRAEDLNQPRLDVAPAAPRPDNPLVQTFVSVHNGLEIIEVTLARTGTGDGSGGTFSLQLHDDAGALIAGQQWRNAQLRHNQTLQLDLTPQAGSAGRRYTLTVEGNEANVFSAWSYSLDVYAGGALAGGAGAAELQFTTRYRLLPAGVLHALARLVREGAQLIALLALLLLLPGTVVLLLAGRTLPRFDPAAWLALAMTLGAVFWPLLWQWTTLLGLRWRQGSVLALLVALALLAVGLAWRRPPRLAPLRSHHLLLLLLLLLALAVRLLAVRDLAFPPWVDSSRHALITRLMAERGQMPDDYLPYLNVSRTLYHYGFHTISASLALLGDWPLARLLLLTGQALGAAVPLALYGGAWMATRRPAAALLAAFLVAFPFHFPAYYATWGRFTQLTGVLVLSMLLMLTWQLLRGARRWHRAWPLVALLAAASCGDKVDPLQ
ncbi:MAG: hypothetical protein RRC07_13145, partial [Anaerolineae bacterium]|nr:hypothetical protein [Anaerolineae bacterium]